MKDLRLKRMLRSALFVLLLSVVGFTKLHAQNANNGIEIRQRADSVQSQAQYVSTMPTNRNVILEKFDGRDCGYCPDGDRIANGIMAANPGRVWAVDIHAGYYEPTSYPNMTTQDGNTIHAGFSISGYPAGEVNRSTAAGQGRYAWTGLVNTQLGQASECNIGGIVIVNRETRAATITVEVYYTANSSADENYLTVAMLQDSILGSQSCGSTFNPEQMLNGQYVHMYILRDIIQSSAWGEAISPTTQGTLITRTYTYQIPEIIGSPNGVDVDLDNIHFLAWVSEQYQGTPTRPILTGCKLDMVQGSDEPIFPIINSVAQNDEINCSHDKIIKVCIQNGGTETLTSMTFETVLQDSTYFTTWEGSVAQYARDTIEIPIEVPFGDHTVNINITEANGEPVDFHSSCEVSCMEWMDFEIEGEDEELTLELNQDKFGNHITWDAVRSDGTVLASGGPYTMLASGTGTQLHIEHFTIPTNECVRFTIYDQMSNGICCSFGHGYYIVKDSHGNVLFGDEDDGEFGKSASHLISVSDGTTSPPIVTYFFISSTSNPIEGGTTSGQGIYEFGQICTLSAAPALGYHFVNWTENDTVVSIDATYTFQVIGNRTLVANFTASQVPTGTIDDAFSVSDSLKVYFSQGNLQYQASTDTWRFATNQYDYIGEDNANISQTYDGWIDLFGWGTSGWDNGNTYYQPWDINSDNDGTLFGPPGLHGLIGEYANADWGVHNPISNGNNQANLWRTLTYWEWDYLFNTRATSSGVRYAKAQVNGVNGLILVPDNWDASIYELQNVNTSESPFDSNVIGLTVWVNAFESNGVVFLPAAGARCYGTTLFYLNTQAYYWSSTCHGNDDNYAINWGFSDEFLGYFAGNRSVGMSVRLVRDVVTQTSNFSQGTNWFSTYVDITLDDLKAALVATGNTSITIKSKTSSTTYNGVRWRGNLNALDLTQMYKIQVNSPCEISLFGMPLNPAEHPITIKHGPNWIGFPLNASMSLTDAFTGFAVNGDVVKSKASSATYNGTRWRGTLNAFEPGQGYIYNSNAAGDRIFTFPTSQK